MTLKRSDRFTIELHTLVRKLRAQTLDSEERERVAEILTHNTTDEWPLPESNVDLVLPNAACALPWTTIPFETVKP